MVTLYRILTNPSWHIGDLRSRNPPCAMMEGTALVPAFHFPGSGGLAILPGYDDSHPRTEPFIALPYYYALGGV